MPEFSLPVDIANRALQHIGADSRLDRVQGFLTPGKPARECALAYGKARQAELEERTWTFATRRTTIFAVTPTAKLLAPTVWSATPTYLVGSIVDDGTGTFWQSRIPNNLNQQPTSGSGAPSTAWEPYFGSMTADIYDATKTYNAGDLVYTTPGDGTYRVYASLINANGDTPGTATAWSATVTYQQNQTVTYNSVAYASLIDLNTNQTPSASPAAWASGTTYAANAQVCGSDGVIYTSIGSGNVGNDPTKTGGAFWTNTGVLCPWSTTIPAGTGSMNWREIGGTDFPLGVGLAELNIVWPIGAGPTTQSGTRNVYRLPAGFRRHAPQDPRAGDFSWLGAPSSLVHSDWIFEGDYLVSWDINPIILRFVADVQDVTKFNTMFCEGLAARIAVEICQPITNSSAKVVECERAYNRAMGRARIINAIEEGAVQAPLDDWIACRV